MDRAMRWFNIGAFATRISYQQLDLCQLAVKAVFATESYRIMEMNLGNCTKNFYLRNSCPHLDN